MGTFYGLEIARTGLTVSQQSINLTGHNIANANTEGYTRQRIVGESIEPTAQYGRFALSENATVGGGVDVQVIDQLRSDFLDREYRSENATTSYWNVKSEEMQYVESLFDELSDTGIAQALSDFYDSLQELSKDPVSEDIRTNVQQNAIKMTETFNYYYNQLESLQSTENEQMAVTVEEINDLISSIATYNKQIFSYELSGESANDLRDKRNLMLDELSGLVNIEYEENSDGHLIVSVEGTELVNHTTATYLEAVADQTGVVTGTAGFYQIYLEGTTTAFSYSDGELEAGRSLRDGNSESEIGIPRIIDRLNTLVQSIAEEYNTIHETGYTMPDGSTASQTGIQFFEVPAGGYSDITAGNFALSSDVLDNVFNIAASDTLIDLSADNTQEGNNEIANELVELSSRTDIATVTNFENYLRSTVVEIAMDSAQNQSQAEAQQSVTDNLDNRRQSLSSVSIDEEMISLIEYQHAYSASSRVLTALDEALDVLINRTGAVGR